MRIPFSKYEGLGNDFVLIEGPVTASVGTVQARHICDRHRGVGGDGVLLVELGGEHPRMKVINADGSVPEMCGNGIRCVALHLARTARAGSAPLTIETDAGPHSCRVLVGGASGTVEVSMRPASLEPADVPVAAQRALRDAPLELGGRALRWTAVSMGNPHAVTFDDPGQARAQLAPAVQSAAIFPHGVNVGFARMHGTNELELSVYERGAGWTQACGTGACAAAVAAVETGRATRGDALAVQLPGGTLSIVVNAPGERISMTGPARHVFDGLVEI